MTINLHLPTREINLKPTITVVGVGGAGGNAVNNMITSNLEGVNFVVANTDAQALDHAQTERVIQLGASITQGLGAGACPDVGRASAEEALEEVLSHITGSHMVFITAGMGGGTGTGAAPVVARMAKEQGILTVAVVTKPFHFEGTHRMKLAENGLEELQKYVDTMIVIPNQNLFRMANERTTFADAFRMADEVLHSGVRGVTDLMVMPGLINLDFADIRTVMREMGKAMMGTGEAEGDRRAVEAAEAAISNPLLDDVSMKGARGVLINITGGPDMTLFEVDEAANRIRDEVDPDANIIFGSTFNNSMEGKMRVSVVATGIDSQQMQGSDDNKTGLGLRSPMSTMRKPEPRKAAEPVAMRQPAPIVEPEVAAPRQETAIDHGGLFSFPEPEATPRSQGRHSPTRFEAAPRYANEAVADESYVPEVRKKDEPRMGEPRFAATPRTPARQAVAQEYDWDAEEEREESTERNFIRRVTARFTPRDEEPAPQRVRSEVSERRKESRDEDYLEIPAFLRRQAN